MIFYLELVPLLDLVALHSLKITLRIFLGDEEDIQEFSMMELKVLYMITAQGISISDISVR